MDLAIGVVTAPRPRPTLAQTLQELRRAGFEQTIRVFAEPGGPVPPNMPGVQIIPNRQRLGLWPNWHRAATTLLRETPAEFLLICEDDVRFARGAARALGEAAESLPLHDWGYVSLYTPWHNVQGHNFTRGWQAVALGRSAWGALAYCFTRDALRAVLHSDSVVLHHGSLGTDFLISAAVREVGRRTYFHIPSLGEHAGADNSSVGHKHLAGMDAVGFNPDFSAFTDEKPRLQPPHTTRPLVTCAMVTGDRREFVLQSVELFGRQTYSPRELLILDDGHDGLASLLPDDPRVRYVRVEPGLSIGEKRNRACELARGEVVVHWDDDDWYGADRLERQMAPLLAGTADITAFSETVFFDLAEWACWECSPEVHRRMFLENVSGGTLVYWKSVWKQLAKFPAFSLAEDAAFLRLAMTNGARLEPIPCQGSYLYIRHGANTWRFHPKGDGWRRRLIPLDDADIEFYRRRHRVLRQHHQRSSEPRP